MLLRWRNDPETRAMSSDTSEISLGEHLAWMHKRLNQGRLDAAYSGLYVAEVNGEPVGTGRIDRGYTSLSLRMDSCKLGYSIDPDVRGKGYGKLLVEALNRNARRMGYAMVCCRIRRSNTKSLLCAAKAGVNSIELF